MFMFNININKVNERYNIQDYCNSFALNRLAINNYLIIIYIIYILSNYSYNFYRYLIKLRKL